MVPARGIGAHLGTCYSKKKDSLQSNITPYGEKFYSLIYWDKIWNLEGYLFEKSFTTENYRMDLWYSGNNGNIECVLDLRCTLLISGLFRHLRINIWFFDIHRVMKPVGRAKIPWNVKCFL